MNEQDYEARAKKLTELRGELSRDIHVLESHVGGFLVDVIKGNVSQQYSVRSLAGVGTVEVMEGLFRDVVQQRIRSLAQQIKELEDVASQTPEEMGFKKADILGITCAVGFLNLCVRIPEGDYTTQRGVEVFYREKDPEVRKQG